MKQTIIFRAALLGAISTVIVPALAQDAGGLRMSFGLNQRIEASSNRSLSIPSAGTSFLSSTGLSFNLSSETRTQSLSFTAGGLLRADSMNTGGNGFVDPNISLAYKREGANARLAFNGSYRLSDISYLRDLSEFIGEDGVLVLPDDFADLTGTGSVGRAMLGARLETGLSDPLGFTLAVNRNETRYINTTSAALQDLQTTSVQLGANLRFSEVFRGSLSFGYTQTTEDDPLGPITATGQTNGLSLTRDLPDGSVSASFNTSFSKNGGRQSLRFSRTKDLPKGQLSMNIGATRQIAGQTAVFGGFSYSHQLPTGSLSLSLASNLSTGDSGNDIRTTTADVGYSYNINDVSSLGLSASMGLLEGSGAFNRIERTDLRINYARELTQDWSLNAGVTHNIRNESSVGRASSTTLFVSVGRKFNFRR